MKFRELDSGGIGLIVCEFWKLCSCYEIMYFEINGGFVCVVGGVCFDFGCVGLFGGGFDC